MEKDNRVTISIRIRPDVRKSMEDLRHEYKSFGKIVEHLIDKVEICELKASKKIGEIKEIMDKYDG